MRNPWTSLLFRLNISGLTVTTVMIALFFAVLRRSNSRAEMRWWMLRLGGQRGGVDDHERVLVFPAAGASSSALIFAVVSRREAACTCGCLRRGGFEFCGRWPRLLESRHDRAGDCWRLRAVRRSCSPRAIGWASFPRSSIAAGFGGRPRDLALLRRDTPSSWLAIAFAARALLSGAEAVAYGVNRRRRAAS